MRFISVAESIFTDALNSLEMAMRGAELEEQMIKDVLKHKKEYWREMEKKNAEFWIKAGIKHAQDHNLSGVDVDVNDIDVVINPYMDQIDAAFGNFNN